MTRRLAALVLGLAVAFAVVACSSNSGSGLTGKAWQWTSGTEPGTPMPGVVPNPENYTAMFDTDGTIKVKADCIDSSGTYTTSSSNMTIALGPTTLPLCSHDSLSNEFLAALPKAAAYSIDAGALKITLSDTGTMTFN
jgi:heat shock protein HslJ